MPLKESLSTLLANQQLKVYPKSSRYIDGLYEYATFVCKQGGSAKQSSSKGVRANQGTIKCGCPVMVRAASMKCPSSGQFVYRLTKVMLADNHEVSQMVRALYFMSHTELIQLIESD
ncbi:hypothetical protein ElyMa_000272700 [Elysia marginata]|uniref:Uncharacterized protein n=1 Tax=Elysia marginata TaxID=1093978 RepID=A0AAV4F4U5_9GAST|nr:hypothetical protein ElyMa_000272700 [Elysia marginata]